MTTNFLEAKVKAVFDDFEQESWCELNGQKLNTTSYTHRVNQQQYILKYYGAYFCELYGMYKKYINQFKGNALNVLSFGCGSGVDCEALNRVIIDLGRNIQVNYVGIDIIDWGYRPNFAWATFKSMCVSNIKASDVIDVDLFIFPKSLTELPYDIRVEIGELIAINNIKDRINFINTYVFDGNNVDGVSQFGTIDKILVTNKWSCSVDSNEYYYKNNSGWLGHNFNFFKLPDDVQPFVKELKDNCNDHDGSAECNNCDIDFIPIFTSRYLAYNLLEYKRSL